MRRHLLEAFEKGLTAADPESLVRKKVRLQGHKLSVGPKSFDLSRFKGIFVLGGGKASARMALGLEEILAGRITGGVVVVPSYEKLAHKSMRILFHRATHPLPSSAGVKGVEKMLGIIDSITRRDLVICVLSGGGSALMPMPVRGVRVEDKRRVTDLLLKSGAKIHEVNTVRKHLSGIKGGRLAERLYPATVVSLIISDVSGDVIGDIASGPTAPDSTTYAEAKKILRKYKLESEVPENIRSTLEKGTRGAIPETPKPGSKLFRGVYNIIVGSSRDSCSAAAMALQKHGYRTLVLSTRLQGEARHAGTFLAGILSSLGSTRFSPVRPLAIVAGGETTVTVKGTGLGGRSQELVLSAAVGIQGEREVIIGSMGTDGRDGPTLAAGALADGDTVERGLWKGLRAEASLEGNDSYHFFKNLNSLITIVPTGTNVGDLVIALAGEL